MKQGHSRIFETMTGDRQKSGEDNQQSGDELDEEILPPQSPPGEMPSYFHVGRLAKECLHRGFKLDAWQLKCIAETNKKLVVCSFGSCNPDITNPFGGFEAYQELGNVHITLDWLTNKEWAADVGVCGEVFGGLAFSTLKTDTFQQKGELKSNLRAAYERSPAKMEVIMPIYNEPLVKGYVLFAPAKDWLLGCRTEYNLEEKGFDKHALCVGYSDGTTEVGLKMENLKELRGSLFQRLGDSWALALKTKLQWLAAYFVQLPKKSSSRYSC